MALLPTLALLILLPLLSQGLLLSSPFLSCGVDSTRKGQCLVLNPSVYETLSSLPVGGEVEFSGFPLSSPSHTAHVTLTRFSAAEDLSDLPLVVLLRGRIFEDSSARQRAFEPFEMIRSSTIFIGLSRSGSHGFAEFGNTTFLLSTPERSLEGADPQMDAYVDELSKAALRTQGQAALSFSRSQASVIFETSALSGATSLPFYDYVLPPQEVVEETNRRVMASQQAGATRDRKVRRTYRVATDADYQMFQVKGWNADNVAGYYYILVGSASSVYARDFGSDLVSSYLKVYTGPDPYPYEALKALQYMQSTWGGSPSRSMAALISAKNLGGGIAYVRTLCNTAWAYAVNGNMVGYFPTPLQNYNGNNWDIYVFLHEVGHVWGASHTHDLNPPADYCGVSPGCGPTAGSIMSYCHQCQNGMSNIYLHFHQYTVNEVWPFISSVAC